MKVYGMKTNRINSLSLIAAAALMAACATTPQDVLVKPATYVVESAKSPRQIATCIADTWDESINSDPAVLRETRTGYLVSAFCNVGYPCSVAKVDPVNAGSKVATHTQGVYGDDFIAIVKKCQ